MSLPFFFFFLTTMEVKAMRNSPPLVAIIAVPDALSGNNENNNAYNQASL